MRKLRSISPFLMVMLLILIGLSSSCDRRNPPTIIPDVPVIDPTDMRIITRVTASPDTIYADNNITYSTISVTVKDGEGFAATNQIVQFKTDLGRVLTNVATDSTGVAKSTFWDDGDVGLATIYAIVRKFDATVTDSIVSADTVMVHVAIIDVPPIDHITLEFPTPASIGPQPLTVMQSINIKARATNVLGNDVPDNTLISFATTRGNFIDAEGNVLGDSVVIKTVNGRASVTLHSGTIAGSGTVTARLSDKSATRGVVVSPGRPANLELKSYVTVDGEMIEADTSSVGSNNRIDMVAKLTDTYNNLCPVRPVKFTTNLGSFMNTTQSVTLNTDINGSAKVRFTPGLQAGAATITALANGDTLQTALIFNISSDDVHSIQFTQEEQITLAVANTGGASSAILRVKLKDINGNLIDSTRQVGFKIINSNPPAGANLNNQAVSDTVWVQSSGGEAQVSVNSGTVAGVLVVRAYCRKNDGTLVYASKPNIIIQAGPPATVVPFIGAFNTGVSMGGGLWRVIAGAVVKDIWGNPVERGTAVRFFLPNDTYNCQIVADAFVGNVSVNGDSLAGVAYTVLTYSGTYSFEPLTIRAETGSGEGNSIYGQAIVYLPMNDPRFEAQSQPGLLNFGSMISGGAFVPYDPPGAEPAILTKETDIYTVLTDGQGNPIHDAKIMLISTNGQFVFTVGTANLPTDPVWMITTDWTGTAIGRIKYYWAEVPTPDPTTGLPGQLSGSIVARILGTNVFAETSVALFNYLGAPPF